MVTNPDRATGLSTEEALKAFALADVAEALAATHPDCAERIALSITIRASRELDADPNKNALLFAALISKDSALVAIAAALAATDPDRAERIARSITLGDKQALALASVAKARAATDSDRAERIAQSIADVSAKARVLAATDPDRAERIAQSITDVSAKARVLASVASRAARPRGQLIHIRRFEHPQVRHKTGHDLGPA